jgi:hypothetical protein
MILTTNPGLPATATTVRYAATAYDTRINAWTQVGPKCYDRASAEAELTHWKTYGNARIFTDFKVAKVTDTQVWEDAPAAGERPRHTAVPPVMVCPPGCPACAQG